MPLIVKDGDHGLFKHSYCVQLRKHVDEKLLFSCCERIFNRNGDIYSRKNSINDGPSWFSCTMPTIEVILERQRGRKESIIRAKAQVVNTPKTLLFMVYFLISYWFTLNFFRYFNSTVIEGRGLKWVQQVFDVHGDLFLAVSSIFGTIWDGYSSLGSAFIIYGVPLLVMLARYLVHRVRRHRGFKGDFERLVTIFGNSAGEGSGEEADFTMIPARKGGPLTYSVAHRSDWKPGRKMADKRLLKAWSDILGRGAKAVRVGYMARLDPDDDFTVATITPAGEGSEVELHGDLSDWTYIVTGRVALVLYLLQVFYINYVGLWSIFPHHAGSISLPHGYAQAIIFTPMVLTGPLAPLLSRIYVSYRARQLREKSIIQAGKMARYLDSWREEKQSAGNSIELS